MLEWAGLVRAAMQVGGGDKRDTIGYEGGMGEGGRGGGRGG